MEKDWNVLGQNDRHYRFKEKDLFEFLSFTLNENNEKFIEIETTYISKSN